MIVKRTTKTVTAVSQSSTLQLTKTSLSLCINKRYRRIYEVAQQFNAKIKPRVGFAFLEPDPMPRKTALWCIQVNNDKINWKNEILDNGNIIKERRRNVEKPLEFQKRVNKGDYYSVGIHRLCFVKVKGWYQFLGVYVLSQLDFDNQTAVFKRVSDSLFVVKTTQRKKITITVETEIVSEETYLF